MKRRVVVEVDTNSDGQCCGRKCIGFDPAGPGTCKAFPRKESPRYLNVHQTYSDLCGFLVYLRCPECVAAEVKEGDQ